MKLLITTLFSMGLLLNPLINKAQEVKNGKITGLVAGEQKPVEAANVSLLKAKDSAFVKMTITNVKGEYEFSAITNGKLIEEVKLQKRRKKIL